jgi:hypothetical protein
MPVLPFDHAKAAAFRMGPTINVEKRLAFGLAFKIALRRTVRVHLSISVHTDSGWLKQAEISPPLIFHDPCASRTRSVNVELIVGFLRRDVSPSDRRS